MKADWHFRPLSKAETKVDSITDEFFASDAISGPGRALVREALQNSLDAARPEQVVRFRILLSTDNRLGSQKLKEVLGLAWPHFCAKKSGLQKDSIPTDDEDCSYLVFEDFGTRGLEGNASEGFEPEKGKNHFYYFFRAEGQSDKTGSERGSWGIGKRVFARESRIRTVIGYTVQADTSTKYLMGRALLKIHALEGTHYSDGYYGILEDETAIPYDQFVLPVSDTGYLDEFARDIGLSRYTEPGLSVIIPWIYPEVSSEALQKSVLRDFFYPILSGNLEIDIETPSLNLNIRKDSFFNALEGLGVDALEIESLAELAQWSLQLSDEEHIRIKMPDPARAWSWSKSLFDADTLAILTEAYRDGERMAVRVPVTIRKVRGENQTTYFDIYLRRDETVAYHYPIFIRDGLIVPDVRGTRTRGTCSIVVIEDLPMASFLRDAENPAHTNWLHDGSNFKNKYARGSKQDLQFVKNSVAEMLNIIAAEETEADPRLLIDFFSLLEEQDILKTEEEKESKTKGETTTTPPKPPDKKPDMFRISQVSGGFSLLPGKKSIKPPATFNIRVAYDTRRGNPLTRYSENDFLVDKPPITISSQSGITVENSGENNVRLKINDSNFHFEMTGFDKNRDLYVKVTAEENSDGSS